MNKKYATGFTLMELIAIIVVVSITVVALLGVFNTSVFRSADPMIRMQAFAVAQGYLEEALLKEFADPDGGETGSCEGGEARSTYDDVQDYNCIVGESPPTDQLGNPMPELATYTVTMNVTAATLGSPAANTMQVTVTVTHSTMPSGIQLVGHRGQY